MQMNPCPFCHEKSRLGVVVKQLRTETSGYVHYGAYCRCKKCKARGPLVRLNTLFDVRNERIGSEKRSVLVNMAIDGWHSFTSDPHGTDGLPLFETKGETK